MQLTDISKCCSIYSFLWLDANPSTDPLSMKHLWLQFRGCILSPSLRWAWHWWWGFFLLLAADDFLLLSLGSVWNQVCIHLTYFMYFSFFIRPQIQGRSKFTVRCGYVCWLLILCFVTTKTGFTQFPRLHFFNHQWVFNDWWVFHRLRTPLSLCTKASTIMWFL